MYKVYIISIFPKAFKSFFDTSLLGKAKKNKKWSVKIIDLKKYATKNNRLDSRPFGGGPGMILRADVLQGALDEVKENLLKENSKKIRKIILCPKGKRLNQALVGKFSKMEGMVLICGRYEGVDQRFILHNKLEQISLGDFILMGGEVASMALVESVVRILPDVIGNPKSLEEETFKDSILEYPQYTKPRVWKKKAVPEVLLSGNHKKIDEWKKKHTASLKKKIKKQ